MSLTENQNSDLGSLQENSADASQANASPQSGYVLLTSAFNEEKYIEATILSVISQTLRPMAWMIISDGSTDGTDSIILKYCRLHDFISFVRVEHDANAPILKFGTVAFRKVNALATGLGTIANLPWTFIGNIDADVTIEPTFFATLLERFEHDTTLGIGGGYIYNVIGGNLVPAFVNQRNVGGPLQMFRRSCYEEIGGYVPYGHEDTIALITARMKGWSTRSFAELKVYHHKTTSWTGLRRCKAKYRLGIFDYIMGDSLLWETLRCLKETAESPAVLGSCLRLVGFVKGMICERKVVHPSVQQFVRSEQHRLLKDVFLKRS
jgi:glycosyltransferase involved in cell wall biosynthesis